LLKKEFLCLRSCNQLRGIILEEGVLVDEEAGLNASEGFCANTNRNRSG